MSSKQTKSVISAKSARKVAAKASKKAGSALAVVSKRLHVNPRVVRHARTTLKGLPGRTARLVKSHPVRVLLGASAVGFVLAKLRHLV
jgi:hypothetical protein